MEKKTIVIHIFTEHYFLCLSKIVERDFLNCIPKCPIEYFRHTTVIQFEEALKKYSDAEKYRNIVFIEDRDGVLISATDVARKSCNIAHVDAGYITKNKINSNFFDSSCFITGNTKYDLARELKPVLEDFTEFLKEEKEIIKEQTKLVLSRLVFVGNSINSESRVFEDFNDFKKEVKLFEQGFLICNDHTCNYTYKEFLREEEKIKKEFRTLVVFDEYNDLQSHKHLTLATTKQSATDIKHYTFIYNKAYVSLATLTDRVKAELEFERKKSKPTIYFSVTSGCSREPYNVVNNLFVKNGYTTSRYLGEYPYSEGKLTEAQNFCILLREDLSVGKGAYTEFCKAMQLKKNIFIFHRGILYSHASSNNIFEIVNQNDWENFARANKLANNVQMCKITENDMIYKESTAEKKNPENYKNGYKGLLAETPSKEILSAVGISKEQPLNLLLMSSL